MKLQLLASVAAVSLVSAGAASAEPNGWYGAIDAGYHIIDDINAESSTTGSNWNYEVNDGWAAFARLGYRFNPNWRVELEGGYRSGDIGTVRAVSGNGGLCNLTPATGGCFSPEGDIESMTLMANVIYDFGMEYWGVRPFVGLGAGVNHVKTETVGNLRDNRGATFSVDDDSTEFAAQAIAGLAWAVGDRTNIDLTYRYLTGDSSWESATVGGTNDTSRPLKVLGGVLPMTPGLSTVGDVDTVVSGMSHRHTIRANSPLTANRSITLTNKYDLTGQPGATLGLPNGCEHRICRSSTATGAFTFTVNTSAAADGTSPTSLGTLEPGQFMDVVIEAGVWVVVGRGSLV